ncbi:MAG: OB-fold nucleic acid binding domain-containing protein [Candidatus Thorarchaeota archaeon]
MLTLEEMIEIVLRNTEYDRKQILDLIRKKRQHIGMDLINDESAAMIVARELGVDLQQPRSSRMRISDLNENMRNVVLTAMIVRIDPVRTFSKSSGEGKVASIVVADESGQIRVALWDDKTKVVEEGEISVGDVIQIRGASARRGLRDALELSLGRTGEMRVMDGEEADVFKSVVNVKQETVKIGSLQVPASDITLVFKVVQTQGLKTFTRSRDGTKGTIMSIRGADETGSARIVFWDAHAEKMKDVNVGEVVRLTGAYTKQGLNGEIEVHAGRSSVIERNLDYKIDVDQASFETQTRSVGLTPISRLETSMTDVDIEAKVISVMEERRFEKEGRSGRLRNVVVADNSGAVRVTFWNEKAELASQLREGDLVRIRHCYVKEGIRGEPELHVGRQGELERNPEDIVITDVEISSLEEHLQPRPKRVRMCDIDDSFEKKYIEVEGIVVAVQESDIFYLACDHPGCRKKVDESEEGYACSAHGKVHKPVPILLYKITLDDGSGNTVRVTLFDSVAEELARASAIEISEKGKGGTGLLEEIRGARITVRGTVRKFRDSFEVSAREVQESSLFEEIRRLRQEVEEDLSKLG